MKFEQEVRNEVAGLLQRLLDSCNPPGDPNPDVFKDVSDRLTRMSILGTAPPSCQPKYPDHGQSGRTAAPGPYHDDFSERKESFIAP